MRVSKKLQKAKEKLIKTFEKTGMFPKNVLNAFRAVEREKFAPKEYREYTYLDTPLPLAENATISAPSMCLLLCKYAKLQPNDKVLEIGTGSGYQAALIAHIVSSTGKGEEGEVYSIEISKKLHELAKENLKKTPYFNKITLVQDDGTRGWPEKKKFQKIIVTATGERIPQPLLDQLKEDGILLIPLQEGAREWLTRVIKTPEDLKKEGLDPVRFVTLQGEFGKKC